MDDYWDERRKNALQYKYYCRWMQAFIKEDSCNNCQTRCVYAKGKIMDHRSERTDFNVY